MIVLYPNHLSSHAGLCATFLFVVVVLFFVVGFLLLLLFWGEIGEACFVVVVFTAGNCNCALLVICSGTN